MRSPRTMTRCAIRFLKSGARKLSTSFRVPSSTTTRRRIAFGSTPRPSPLKLRENSPAAATIAARISGGVSSSSGRTVCIAASAAASFFNVTRGSSSEWDQSMLLLRAQFPFSVQRLKRLGQIFPCFRRFDDVVHQPAACSDNGVGKRLPIFVDHLLAAGCLIFRSVDFTPENDLCGAFSTHDCDLSRGPRYYAVCAQALGAHSDICAAVGFAQDNGDFWHSGSGVGKQEFGAVTNDASALLFDARKKSRHVDKRQQGNVKCIAVADEARRFVRGIYVQRAGQDTWLVRDNPHGPALQTPKADDD